VLLERKAVGGGFHPMEWLRLLPQEAKRRSALLAAVQARGAP
jgi:hypothetical protein